MNIIIKPFKYSFFNAAFMLIIINVLFFAAQRLIPQLTWFLTMRPDAILRGEVWRFVSYMFAHASFTHILFNMIGLYVFGSPLERSVGSREFLLYYLLTGILAGVFSFGVFLVTGSFYSQLLGASGALFAVQLAYAVLFPNSIIYFWGILPLRAGLMVILFTALELFSSVTGANPGVAHFTHLAGFLFGWLYFLIRFRVNPAKRLFSRR
ncbi:MAG: rhomboid family intramembrane serine protease [Spirochaetaceae bacterium]|jgi:membrane associated rhomboid family serine protease|nr:rhomboid family intramembrane serine protease [Spirochaetaceae bacterium]